MLFLFVVEVIISYDPEKQVDNHLESVRNYQLNMSDFRFFTVIKHEGEVRVRNYIFNENFLSKKYF